MKTLILTIAAASFATIFSSCSCGHNGSQTTVKHFDSKGRLVKEIQPGGNYNTYRYQDNPSYHSTKKARSTFDGSWKPTLP